MNLTIGKKIGITLIRNDQVMNFHRAITAFCFLELP